MSVAREVEILMADLSGYTAATEIHGAQSAFNLIQTYLRIADESLHGQSKILERIGGQIVIVSEQPMFRNDPHLFVSKYNTM